LKKINDDDGNNESGAKIVNNYKYGYIEELKMNFDREIIGCK